MNRLLIKNIGILLIILIPAGFEACGGGGGGVSPASIAVSQVAVTPSLLALPKGSVQQFSAKDLSGSPIPVTWSLTYPATTSSGTIDPTGLYHAPANLPDDNLVTVQATYTADSTKWGSVSFFLTTGPSLNFSTTPADVTSAINFHGPPLGLKMASSKGKVHLTWVTTDQVNGTHLWYSSGDKSGSFTVPHDVLNDVNISAFGSFPNPENPAIATDGTNIFIAWDDNITHNYQVYLVRAVIGSSIAFAPYAVMSNNNSSLQAEPSSTEQQQIPSIACSLRGKVELSWEVTANSEIVIHYIELENNGKNLISQNVPATASPNHQIGSSVGSDLNGNVSIAWVDANSVQASPPNIFYSTRPSGQTAFTAPELVEPFPFGGAASGPDSYSMAMDTTGVSHLAFSITSAQTSTTQIYSASNTGSFFSVPAFRKNGFAPTLKIDLLNDTNLSWWDGSQSVYFMKSNLAFNATSSYKTSGANPVMDIDEGGRVNLVFTTSIGQNFSTWFTRGE